jgi:hypothetical protein
MSVFVGLPIYRQTDPYQLPCLDELLHVGAQRGWHVERLIGDSLVSRARNTLTARFMRSSAKWFLQIDSDILFSVEMIDRMLSHGLGIVGGMYPLKQKGPLRWCLNYDYGTETDPGYVARVKYIGTGFLLVHRDAMQRVWDVSPEYIDDTDKLPARDVFSVGVHAPSKRYLSEDWMFCQKALDVGMHIHADLRVVLKHVDRKGDVVTVYPTLEQEEELGRVA